MSLIGFSLNYVFIKFAHIEFPLFKVSHYLHCTLRLLAIYFFFLYWACPLSNLLQVGSLIPQVAFASIGSANPRSLQAGAKIGQMEDLLCLISYLECAHQIAISAGGRSRS